MRRRAFIGFIGTVAFVLSALGALTSEAWCVTSCPLGESGCTPIFSVSIKIGQQLDDPNNPNTPVIYEQNQFFTASLGWPQGASGAQAFKNQPFGGALELQVDRSGTVTAIYGIQGATCGSGLTVTASFSETNDPIATGQFPMQLSCDGKYILSGIISVQAFVSPSYDIVVGISPSGQTIDVSYNFSSVITTSAPLVLKSGMTLSSASGTSIAIQNQCGLWTYYGAIVQYVQDSLPCSSIQVSSGSVQANLTGSAASPANLSPTSSTAPSSRLIQTLAGTVKDGGSGTNYTVTVSSTPTVTSTLLSVDNGSATITSVSGAITVVSAGQKVTLTGPPSPLLFASVLPGSRSVQVGATATAFAAILNAGTSAAQSCSLAPPGDLPTTFSYQTTNPSTNQPVGTANTPVNIPAGTNQTFFFSMQPSASFNPTNVHIGFACNNTAPVATLVGINTLLLSASKTPTPDVIALGATLQNDGIVHAPGPSFTGVFAVATVNLGSSDTLTVATNSGAATLPMTVKLCQTNPTTGVCLQTPSSTVAASIVANATPTFGVFVSATGTVALDPANSRIFVTFTDSSNAIRGETSVAVATQ